MTLRMSQIQLRKVKTDDIQLLVAKGIKLHPIMQQEFLKRLAKAESLGHFCPLPTIILQRFSDKLHIRVSGY